MKAMNISRVTDRHLESSLHVDTRPLYLTLGVVFVKSSAKSRSDILLLQVLFSIQDFLSR